MVEIHSIEEDSSHSEIHSKRADSSLLFLLTVITHTRVTNTPLLFCFGLLSYRAAATHKKKTTTRREKIIHCQQITCRLPFAPELLLAANSHRRPWSTLPAFGQARMAPARKSKSPAVYEKNSFSHCFFVIWSWSTTAW